MQHTNTNKQCRACAEVKPLAGFAKHPSCTDGHRGTCRACLREKRRVWQQGYVERNLERLRAEARHRSKAQYPLVAASRAAKYRENLEENREAARVRYHKTKDVRQANILLATAKRRAKMKGLPFDLNVDDIIVPAACPVLGTAFAAPNRTIVPTSATLDRIEPAKGYVRGNVIVVSALANQIKASATAEQIMKVAKFYAHTSG